jgi:hypothetical protein
VWKQHWFWKRFMDDDNHHIANGNGKHNGSV